MRTLSLGERPHSRLLVLDAGEEVMEAVARFADDAGIGGGWLSGIGGFSEARVGFFERAAKDYVEHLVDEQVEVLGLHGNLSTYEGRPRIHLHAVVGLADGSARGGHVLSARVWPTLEVLVTESPLEFRRELDESSGLPLIRP